MPKQRKKCQLHKLEKEIQCLEKNTQTTLKTLLVRASEGNMLGISAHRLKVITLRHLVNLHQHEKFLNLLQILVVAQSAHGARIVIE